MSQDPFYRYCVRQGLFGHECAGRITWEHALKHGGRQIQAKWAIIPVCERGHAVNRFQDAGDMNKEVHVWVALNRATDEELEAISGAVAYKDLRSRLCKKYGLYTQAVHMGIGYPSYKFT